MRESQRRGGRGRRGRERKEGEGEEGGGGRGMEERDERNSSQRLLELCTLHTQIRITSIIICIDKVACQKYWFITLAYCEVPQKCHVHYDTAFQNQS